MLSQFARNTIDDCAIHHVHHPMKAQALQIFNYKLIIICICPNLATCLITGPFTCFTIFLSILTADHTYIVILGIYLCILGIYMCTRDTYDVADSNSGPSRTLYVAPLRLHST